MPMPRFGVIVKDCFTSSINAVRCKALRRQPGRATPQGMGQRPIKRDTSVNVRLTSDEREALERLAARNRRTLSDYIRVILQDHVRTEEAADAGAFTEASTKRRAD
jgi:hypothetical protein